MDYFPEDNKYTPDRRALTRLIPAGRISVAVELGPHGDALGLAEVADFSGLGLGLRGLAGDTALAPGTNLWLTLVAEEGLISLRATLTHRTTAGHLGCQLNIPAAVGQQFLLRLYERTQEQTRTSVLT